MGQTKFELIEALDDNDVIPVSKAAEVLCITRGALYIAMQAKRLPSTEMLGKKGIRVGDVRNYPRTRQADTQQRLSRERRGITDTAQHGELVGAGAE